VTLFEILGKVLLLDGFLLVVINVTPDVVENVQLKDTQDYVVFEPV